MIQRLYDLTYLRDVRLVKHLFPAPDPVPAPAFPKPGQAIRLAYSSADELPPPAFPKPAQLDRWIHRPRTFAGRPQRSPVKLGLVVSVEKVLPAQSSEREVTENVPEGHARAGSARPAADPLPVEYLKELMDLAQNELARAAIQEDFDTIARCFGAAPDAVLFARGYEQYLVDRNAAADDLQRVFRHYSWWLNLKREASHSEAHPEAAL